MITIDRTIDMVKEASEISSAISKAAERFASKHNLTSHSALVGIAATSIVTFLASLPDPDEEVMKLKELIVKEITEFTL